MALFKTAITFGLVNIPVRLNPVIKNNDTSFNYLHKTCLNRVNYIKYCPHCKKDVKNKDLIKGYEYSDDKYVTFDDEDFEKLKSNEDKSIDIISFVNFSEIDPIYNNEYTALFETMTEKDRQTLLYYMYVYNKDIN